MNTLLIKNVFLEGKITDILVEGNKIARIGSGIASDAGKTLQCDGQLAAVVPFYNTHTHTAMTLLVNTALEIFLPQRMLIFFNVRLKFFNYFSE